MTVTYGNERIIFQIRTTTGTQRATEAGGIYHTSGVMRINGSTVILNFFKNYLFISLLLASLAFFWFLQQLLFGLSFYDSNRSKTLSFHRCLQFLEKEKISGVQVQQIWLLRHDYGYVCDQKLTHKHRCVRYHDHFPQFCSFLTKLLYLIDRTTLWQELIMHQTSACEENSEQNLHI